LKLRHACLLLALGLTTTEGATLPLIGGAYGQSVRFSIAAGRLSCTAVVRLSTRDLLPAAEKRFALRPGESDFVDVNLNSLTDRYSRRADLLPAVRAVSGSCWAAMEVYDQTSGRVVASLPVGELSSYVASTPSGTPPMLLAVTASSGQIIHLGVARGFDPQPDPPACNVTLGFVDATGSPVGPSKTVYLTPGAIEGIDLDVGLLLPATGAGVQRFIRPRLLLPASIAGTTQGCGFSVQVYDRGTGATTSAWDASR
jgi:hypothetical protein